MTLVEILVTLAIVAVLSTVVVLGLGVSGRGADPRSEANRLAGQLGGAVDDALVTRRPLALSWDAESYGFVARDEAGRWIADTRAPFGPRHPLPRGLRLTGDAPALLIIDGDGAGSRIRLAVADAKRAWTVEFDGLTATTRAGPA